MKFKRFLKAYFIAISIIVHCVIIGGLGYFVADKVTSHWRWSIIKHQFLGDTDTSDVYQLEGNSFEFLPRGRWFKIHQQHPDNRVRFTRQSHAGSSFDSLRGRLLLFGSDTHGENWDNSLYFFDMESLQWVAAYKPDLPETYTVNLSGIPVAGVNKDNPWAMHTFGALTYDSVYDKLVVASFPAHLAPNKYGQKLESVWNKVEQHPTWLFDLSTSKWMPYVGGNVHFFPYTISYDSNRGIVTGFRPDGVFEWNSGVMGWEKVGSKVYPQWHTNAVYDSANQIFVLYGGNEMLNATHVYRTGNDTTEEMPTTGQRPPAGQSVPLAFHEKLGKVVALIDVEGYAQTWLYDYSQDQWQRDENADFPYKVGMNYSMEYDLNHDVVVLVSSPKYEETAVWVLKL